MTLRARRTILIILAVLFLIAGPAIIFYANGWRLDFKKFRVVRIGGIFLKDLPTDAGLKINGGLADSSFKKFLSGTLVNNLLPGDYSLAIEKDGYYSWMKTVGVQPATVAEIRVILIPKESQPIVLTSWMRNFWINGSNLIYLDGNWQYFLTDINDPKSGAKLEKKLALELLKGAAPDHKSSPEEETVLSEFENKYRPKSSGITKYVYSNNKIYLLKNGKLFFLEIQ